ncbi:unnamed protein product [Lactuca saligna]|uniref:PB1-like domain-containing protein n=1 Tax=Lactuca saligna TaxID=75948 RepID=A0AA35Z0F2_LACSI|nr:unnamed protein product [Lactuca saligna]
MSTGTTGLPPKFPSFPASVPEIYSFLTPRHRPESLDYPRPRFPAPVWVNFFWANEGSNPSIFSIKLFYNGVFTKFPERRYIKGKEKYVDLVDIAEFSVHDIDEMTDILGCVEEGKSLYYHFKRPLSDLYTGLFALACDSDINHLRTYVEKHNLIEVYTEHEVDHCGKPPYEPQFEAQGFDHDMLWKCTTVQDFHHAMEKLNKLNNDCYEWVKYIPPQHWARSHFTGRVYCDGLLKNLCESINSQLQKEREQPIITCLEFIREYLMVRIVLVQKTASGSACNGGPSRKGKADGAGKKANGDRKKANGARKGGNQMVIGRKIMVLGKKKLVLERKERMLFEEVFSSMYVV